MELDLLDNLVKCLFGMLEKPDLAVADYPIGLPDKLKDFEDTVLLPQQKSGKPQIFGISGSGGVGKTTFLKHFFNAKKSDYHNSCFLFEVRDNAAKSSLESLQIQLLKNLAGSDTQVNIVVNSVDEGKMMLRSSLKSSKALVILDDVNDVNHVHALLPVQTYDLC